MSEPQNFENLAKMVQENTKPEMVNLFKEEAPAHIGLIPNGMKAVDLKPFVDAYKTKPDRRTGTAIADRLPSFVDIVNRFKSGDSAIFGKCAVGENKIEAQLLAILNYHPADPDNTQAAFADHRVCYKFPVSADCAFWLKNNKTPMGQLEFAHLLEERMLDLAVPAPEDAKPIEGLKPKFAGPLQIIELSKNLELYSNESFSSKNKIYSGETEFKFSCEHVDGAGKPIRIPDFFIISIALFDGAPTQRVPVRLRYRTGGGKIVWFYDLYRIDLAFEEAYDQACALIAEKTQLPLFHGTP